MKVKWEPWHVLALCFLLYVVVGVVGQILYHLAVSVGWFR